MSAPMQYNPSAAVPIPPSSNRTPISPSSSSHSLAHRRISTSTSSAMSSRRSSLMHEIQPPPRRLSAHQVLLLTPFGGAVPLETPTMGRQRSSQGTGSLPRRLSRPTPHSTAPSSMSMGREPSLGPPSPRSTYTPPPRTQHSVGAGPSAPSPRSSYTAPSRTRHSLASGPPAPSPLSQPLTTIASSSDKESSPSSASASREASGDEPDAVPISAVEMTRSNSLPVLTLRELEAMKEKDSELGIARGGDWAWVGRDEEDVETPGLSDTSTLSSTPPSFPFVDPFASAQQGTYRRTEETARFGSYQPVATAEGYHYSPSANRDRRVSDIPSPPPTDPHSTPRPGPSSGLESPRGTHMPAHQRPKITRYKTSPALSEGLGLAVIVRPEATLGVQVDADAGGSLGRKGRRINLSTVERREQRHAQLRDDTREFGERRGSWTPVDIVDGLEVAHRSSISSSSSRGSFALPRLSISSSTSSRGNLVLVETTRAMSLSEFGSPFAARSRVDSLDSTKSKSPTTSFATDVLPRRGSLGIQASVGLWRKRAEEGRRGSGDEPKSRATGMSAEGAGLRDGRRTRTLL